MPPDDSLELFAEPAPGIAPGAPVLRLCITSVDARGVPLIFSEFLGRGDRFHYQLTVKR